MSHPSAEEKKELGNKAFAAQNYDDAIKYYTDAIKIDPNNHVYFSNRSASYGGKKQWKPAADDAKECIRLEPTFIKGYYRLATAQIELGDFDGAQATIKQGLNIDADNSQLQKQLRLVKAKRVSQRRSAATGSSSSSGHNGISASLAARPSVPDSSVSREVRDLQEQLILTSREYNVVKANIHKSQRECRMNEVTREELIQLPNESNSKMYRGIGKMFMLSSRSDVLDHLDRSIKDEQKKESDLKQKLEYLERRIKSQQQNIQELTKSPSAE